MNPTRSPLLAMLMLAAIVFSLPFLVGCDTLRFAPNEEQKAVAYDTYRVANQVNVSGTEPGSPASERLVTGTAASLAYTGLPANPAPITDADYPTTAKTAQQAAQQRPTAGDVIALAEGGLSLAEALATALGFGGVVLAGRSITNWVSMAKQKAAALQEVVTGNQAFLNQLKAAGNTAIVDQFKEFQNKAQITPETSQIVYQLKPTV